VSSMENRATDPNEASVAFKRRFLIRLTAVLLGGMILDGFILGIIGPVSDKLTKDLGVSSLWEGLIAAAALLGILFGSPVGGWAGDKFGRKPLFLADIILFTVASAVQFFVTGPAMLFWVRLAMGIAIGAEYSVGWPLMSEFSPAHLRGRLMGATQIAWYGGFMIAYFIGFELNAAGVSWRIILGSSTIIAVVLLLARFGLPESPRWLWNVGRHDEARAVAHKYMQNAADMDDVEHEDDTKGSFGMLFNAQHWRATLFMSVFWFCAVAPYFAIATFADTVLQQYGLSGGLAGGVGLSAVALAGVVLTVFLIDKVGRRVLTVPPQWLCTVVLAIIGLWAGAPPIIVLALFLIFSFFNAMYNALTGIYPGEVFPTEIRGMGTGFAAAVSRLGAAAGTFLLPWAITHLGIGPSMLIAAAVAAIGAGVSQWLAPETKGMSLTEAAAAFSH
jgi:MFS transporter, putative metabolite transport protein